MIGKNGRILIATSTSPFTAREELYLAELILNGVKNMGFVADMFMLPIVQDPLFLPEQMMGYRLLDIQNSCDLLITIGFPAFLLKHSQKKVILFSLATNLHEWFDSEYGILSTPQYNTIRELVHAAERKGLLEAKKIFCASSTMACQIDQEFQLKTDTFHFDYGEFNNQKENEHLEEESWIVCESTLEPCDRIDILLNAITYSKADWKLHIFIPAASNVYMQALLKSIITLGIVKRIKVTNESISSIALDKSRAYVNLLYSATRIPMSVQRAVRSFVPIITTTDCGAILDVISDNINGLIVKPNAKDLAQALDQIMVDNNLNKSLSEGNKKKDRGYSDDTDIDSLLEILVS